MMNNPKIRIVTNPMVGEDDDYNTIVAITDYNGDVINTRITLDKDDYKAMMMQLEAVINHLLFQLTPVTTKKG